MKICNECGKKLKVFEGYRHPVLGQNILVCSYCFDIVNDSLENYQNFISSYIDFFISNDLSKQYEMNLKKIASSWLNIKTCIN